MNITLEALARAAGEPLERVREWRAAGVLGEGEPFTLADLERVRLVALLRRRGITLDAIAARRGEIDLFLRRIGRRSSSVGTVREAAARIGLDPGLAEEAWTATGLPAADLLDERDVELLRGLQTMHDVGLPGEGVVEIARVMGDTVRRVTEAMARIVRFQVIRPLIARGLDGLAFDEAVGDRTGRLIPLAPRLLAHLTERLLAEASRENFALRLLGDGTEPGQVVVAIVFVDLCSFTPLAEAMGDRESAEVVSRFSALVRDATAHHDGRVAKQIGDGFMLVFADASAAVACAVEIDRQAACEPRFPAVRSGIQWGPVLYRDGDYVGMNANIAARVADEAGRHEVVVTEAVRRAAASLAGVEFQPLASRRLKGLTTEIELFRAVGREAAAGGRVSDPVCGMEIGAAEAAARLSVGGQELAFCSAQCLQRYVAEPTRYTLVTG